MTASGSDRLDDGAAQPRRVVLAGGGTAGHVVPALAIADAMVRRGRPRSAIGFIGARRGMEAEMVPAAGYRIDLLPVRNFAHRLSLSNLGAAADQLRGVVSSWSLIDRRSTAAVVSVGGFASVPPVVVARLRRVPVLAVSYDAHAGLASKLAGRLAVANAVAFAPIGTTRAALPRAVVTGAPVRRSLLTVDRARDRAGARATLGLPTDRFVVLVVGGSLGSGTLNATTNEFVATHGDRVDLAIRHVVGARNADSSPPSRTEPSGIIHQVVPFETQMDQALAAADLVVARAGASTVAELAAMAMPSILVPWPGAAADHQRANARWLLAAGGAVVIEDSEWDAARMALELDALMADPDRLEALSVGAESVGTTDGADRVAELIERYAR